MQTNKKKLSAIVEAGFKSIKETITLEMGTQIGNDNWADGKAVADYERVLRNRYFSSIQWLSVMSGGKQCQ